LPWPRAQPAPPNQGRPPGRRAFGRTAPPGLSAAPAQFPEIRPHRGFPEGFPDLLPGQLPGNPQVFRVHQDSVAATAPPVNAKRMVGSHKGYAKRAWQCNHMSQ